MTPSTVDSAPDQVLEPGPSPLADPVISPADPAPLVANAVQKPDLLNQLLNQLLKLLAATPLRSLDDLLAAARIVALAALAGLALRLTGATLGAIHEFPLLSGLLELVGLVSALNFLARNALRQQKRAELLERIQQLRRQLLG